MLTHLTLLAALLPSAAEKTDAEKIQGTWDVVKVVDLAHMPGFNSARRLA